MPGSWGLEKDYNRESHVLGFLFGLGGEGYPQCRSWAEVSRARLGAGWGKGRADLGRALLGRGKLGLGKLSAAGHS